MNSYILIILVVGLSSLGMVFMPAFSRKTGISYTIPYLLVGVGLYWLWPGALPDAYALRNSKLTLHLTELVVIISLMGTGIKIDRRFSWKNWSSPLRMIAIAMVLCIGVVSFFGHVLLGLGLPGALLLGAVLAPTDPVLAADVQVGPPNEKIKSETRFTLTSEAGMNDGMAFPFTWLAITLCLMVNGEPAGLGTWFTYHLVYQITAGFVLGYLSGKGMGYLIFRLSRKYDALKPRDGLLAIALTFCVYGITEALHAYGFIAVFICAVTLRHSEKTHRVHGALHSFTDQIERLMLGVMVIFFGNALAGGLLESLDMKMVFFAVIFITLIRPLITLLSLAGAKVHFKEKLAIGFFGIRGMGSIFYLVFAFQAAAFAQQDTLWSTVAFTILASISIHGLSSSSAMRYLKMKIPEEEIPDDGANKT